MSTVLACLDGSIYSGSVAEHAAWAARRLGASVELLQVLGRRDSASGDRSGRVFVDGQQRLLEQLAEMDAERFKLLQANARLVLEAARQRIEALGVCEIAVTLRTGDLIETMAEREETAEIVVVGKRGEAADFAKLHLGSNLERIVRSSRRPVLIAARAFREPKRALIAFDGRSKAQEMIAAIAEARLLGDAQCDLVTIGAETAEGRRRLDDASARLKGGGLRVTARFEQGQPERTIPEIVARDGIDLLVMGAYGHSQLRSLVLGSTTSEVIRGSLVSALVFR
ncbi:universal stress protein [Rubrimonas cliftonensis]|uniref:Nucleotide-binding universal stress protein, UspA family n=1 Tax=Rubrimonas cliftonensis TaxID=89524 RepID=A0A1H4CJT2_9RHOB|nr:universal stress protein [Rubrimonas cliftonensis]SEA60685.1 Nucleotide-binding universal stress protein, UspA family [Rubrimonas cliftonensis]